MTHKNFLSLLVITLIFSSTTLWSQITVTNPLDDGSAGTLRMAIKDAPIGAVITVDPKEDRSFEIVLNEPLIINKDLTLIIPFVYGISVSNPNGGRIFTVNNANFKLRGPFLDGGSDLNGGAILLNNSDVTLSNLTIRNSNAIGDPSSGTGNGGAVFVSDCSTLNADFITIENCSATNDGGAIYISKGGTLRAESAELTYIEKCEAGNNGGGLYSEGDLEANSMLITECKANGTDELDGGGGIYHKNGTLELTNGGVSMCEATGAKSYGGGLLHLGNASIKLFEFGCTTSRARNGGGAAIISDDPTSEEVQQISLFGGMSNNEAISANGGDMMGKGGGLYLKGNYSFGGGAVGFSNNIASSKGGGIYSENSQIGIGSSVNGSSLSNNTAMGNTLGDGGGAIYCVNSEIVLSGFTGIDDNSATGAFGVGGAIYAINSSVVLGRSSSERTTFENNTATMRGGGIYVIDGSLNIKNEVNFENNRVLGSDESSGIIYSGGAIYAENTDVRTNDPREILDPETVTFINNQVVKSADVSESGYGGAIYFVSATGDHTLAVEKTKFENNIAAYGGGALSIGEGVSFSISTSSMVGNSASFGGGFYIKDGNVATIERTTIAENTATISGGGIFNKNPNTTIRAATIVYNEAEETAGGIAALAATSINSTVVARNLASVGREFTGELISNNYNLIFRKDEGINFDVQGNDILGDTPFLVSVTGDETSVVPFRDNSPLINNGDPSYLEDDQVGNSIFDNRRDIGAFESEFESPTLTTRLTDEIPSDQVTLYPNPANTTFTINLPESTISVGNLSIYTLNGSLVKEFVIQKRTENAFSISELLSGSYLIVARDSVGTPLFRKFIVKY